jgi:hypothetical protein
METCGMSLGRSGNLLQTTGPVDSWLTARALAINRSSNFKDISWDWLS